MSLIDTNIQPLDRDKRPASLAEPQVAAQAHGAPRMRSLAGQTRLLLLALVPAAIAAVLTQLQPWVPPSELTMDTIAFLDGAIYDGAISQAGVLLWMVAATAALMAAALLRSERATGLPAGTVEQFFWAAGAFSVVLMADDLWLFHEQLLPNRLGIPQDSVFAVYVVAAAVIAWRYSSVITSFAWFVLSTAISLFAVSQVMDVFFHMPASGQSIEDTIKFVGIACWATFFAHAAFVTLRRRPASPVDL